ncbi:MAG: hypothetical protein K1X88_27910 [Nannocystaceae bacterium]|nr:hypothetical protein [Nannocystaceae bacterium]
MTVLAAVACGAPGPRSADPTLPTGPEPTLDALPVPSLDVAWDPPATIAGDLGALARTIGDAPRLRVQLGPRLDGPLWRRRVETALVGLGVGARLEFVPAQPLSAVLPGAAASAAPDDATRDALAIAAPWRSALGAGAPVLVIDDAPVSEATWRAQPAAVAGTCEPALAALARGQEQGLAQLEPFLDWADAAILTHFRIELGAAMPQLRKAVAPHRRARDRSQFADAAAFAQHECGHALAQLVAAHEGCVQPGPACAWAPRLLLVGGARIGAPQPEIELPQGCASLGGVDVPAVLRGAGRDAAEAAAASFEPQWIALADRLGTITEVHAALEDVCAPRRRRFADDDLVDARARLRGIGLALASPEPPRPSRWRFFAASLRPRVGPARPVGEGTSFFVPGVGLVRELARYDAGAGSPSRRVVDEARALRQFVLARAICRSGRPALPLALALIELGASARVRHLGYVYEEELSCGELPPRIAPAQGPT